MRICVIITLVLVAYLSYATSEPQRNAVSRLSMLPRRFARPNRDAGLLTNERRYYRKSAVLPAIPRYTLARKDAENDRKRDADLQKRQARMSRWWSSWWKKDAEYDSKRDADPISFQPIKKDAEPDRMKKAYGW